MENVCADSTDITVALQHKIAQVNFEEKYDNVLFIILIISKERLLCNYLTLWNFRVQNIFESLLHSPRVETVKYSKNIKVDFI